MRILFTVLGEGRGHLTQAIGMQDILQRHGRVFSLDPLLTPTSAAVSARFQRWVHRADTTVIRAIESAAGRRPATCVHPELRPGPVPA